MVISQTVNAEMSVGQLVHDYSVTRAQLMRHRKDTVTMGQQLLDRLAVPVLVHQGYVCVGLLPMYGERRMFLACFDVEQFFLSNFQIIFANYFKYLSHIRFNIERSFM